MTIQEYKNKIGYIIKEEGLRVFGRRAIGFVCVKVKRPFIKDTANIKKWKGIKNRYVGKRAFLVGNGPSLNYMPLHLLRNEYTMCFNRIDLMFERLGWKPTMYSTIDDRVAVDTQEEIRHIIPQVKYAFFPDLNPYNVDFRKFIPDSPNVFWLHLDDLNFRLDLPKAGINKTVANVGLQILVYMGFNPIYFIGVDLEYKEHSTIIRNDKRNVTSTQDDDPNHFDPRYFGKGRQYHYPRITETMERFRAAKRFYEKEGVKIYNAGFGGQLDVFPRVDFNSLFNFSTEQELEMVLEPIGELLDGVGQDSVFDSGTIIESCSEWEPNLGSFLTNEKLGPELIQKAIFTHIPIGPFRGKYYFHKRPERNSS